MKANFSSGKQKHAYIYGIMSQNVKKYCALLFLFLLLFPLAEKGIHAFEHHDEVHCTITDKHFHEQEHECSICDFTVTDTNGIPSNNVSFSISSRNFYFQEFIQSVNIPNAYSNLPSRAPPVS